MGLKPILRTTTSFSALTLLVGSFDPKNDVPDMTYNVFSGTLNPTQSLLKLTSCIDCWQQHSATANMKLLFGRESP